MLSFVKYNPTKLWFGEGQIAQLKSEIGEGKRVLVVYGGGSIKKNGVYDAVLAQLNAINAVVFELSGVEPNPRLSTVHKGIDICNNENIDLLLAVGGGSVIDCTKAIAIGTNYDGDVWDIITKKAVGKSALPFGTVLTLAATGSEMNAGSVITNWETNEKVGWGSPFTFPAFSILDPTYTKSVPLDQTVYGIVDTMSHAFEQYFNVGENTPITDGFTESLLRTVMETAPKLIKDLDNYGLRETMMYSSTLALNGTLSPGVGGGDWASHGIEHAVSAVYDIPHGGGLAIIFPSWMKHTAQTNPRRMKQLAINLFHVDPTGKTDLEIATEGIAALRTFWNAIGAPSTLGDYNIDDAQLDAMVEKACPGNTIGYYKPLTKDDVREILTDCM